MLAVVACAQRETDASWYEGIEEVPGKGCFR